MKLERNKYFHALALFIISRRKSQELDGLMKEMNTILGSDDPLGTHANDMIFSPETSDEERDFREALRRMEITWETQEDEEKRMLGK